MHYFIGLDIGTTHTKAVVTDQHGRILVEQKMTYAVSQTQPGFHEQNPEAIVEAFLEVTRSAVDAIADKSSITHIGISAAMHSLILVDEQAVPITPMLTWADTRAVNEAQSLKGTTLGNQFYQRTGVPIHPMSPLCKLAWFKNHEPDLLEKASRVVSIKELIWFRLFGEWVVDESIASATGLMDLDSRQWLPDALQWCGVDSKRLSRIVPVDYHREKPALITQVDPSTKFIIGGSDGFLANLGSGAVSNGEMALTIGTSGAVRVLREKPSKGDGMVLFHYAADPQHYLSGGAVNNGGNTLQWFTDIFLDGDDKHAMEKAAMISPGADGLVFLPYLLGERAPVWDATATGMFAGIRATHTRAHFLRAVLEGVAFSLRQIKDAIVETGEEIKVIYASGGFINSPLWTRIITDVMKCEVRISHAADASALGAIFLCMKSAGLISNWSEIKKYIHTDEVLLPDEENGRVYDGRLEEFRRKVKIKK